MAQSPQAETHLKSISTFNEDYFVILKNVHISSDMNKNPWGYSKLDYFLVTLYGTSVVRTYTTYKASLRQTEK